VSDPRDTGTLGNPAIGGLTDEEPVVRHPPVQGGIGITTSTSTAGQAPLGPPPLARAVLTPAPADPFADRATAEDAVSERVRASSLDALRGVFMLVITLSFTIHPRYFPDWMYHRQFPPPFTFVDVPGLTWRDIAYAAFLFTMAAAIPITLSRRIARGETEVSIVFAAMRRFLLLFVFALLIGHSNTYFTGYTQTNRAIAILGFFVMFALFVRRRDDWDAERFRVFRAGAWVAAIAFLLVAPQAYGGSFSPTRIDDIMAGLAFAALWGSVIWYFTRQKTAIRIAILAAVAILTLASRQPGWVHDWWWSSPVPWLMQPSSMILLTVVIPGTIAGDLTVSWLRASTESREARSWIRSRIAALPALCIAIVVVTMVGLDNRWVLETTQIVFALCAMGFVLTHAPQSASERLVRGLFSWGTLWLILGLFLDPAEGGIRKVPENLSYFFTVAGLTTMLLIALTAVIDMLKKTGWARPLVNVGSNPMLAYVVFAVFLNSLLEMIPAVRPVLRWSAGEAMLRSILTLVAVVLIVQAFTRRRIIWRA
jgi:predicted acyltransferase